MSHHFVSVSTLPAGGEKLKPETFAKATGLLKLVAIAGLVLSAVFFLFGGSISFGSKHFLTGEEIHYSLRDVYSYSWLFAFVLFFTLSVGGLFWVLLHNVSNSGWGVAIRRLPETLSMQLPVLFLLGLPLLFPQIRETLWHWIHEHAQAAKGGAPSVQDYLHEHNHLLHHKFGYLSLWWGVIPGWIPRYFIFFAALCFAAFVLYRYSTHQDVTGNPKNTLSARFHSSWLMIVFAVSSTFASFDWVKSLNYTWFSTMFGVNFFAGAAGASMAILIIVATTLVEKGYLKRIVTTEHFFLMGKLQFAFTVFWAYIAFSQFFLIWYANIAEETQFYGIRNTDGWRDYSVLCLVIGHFFLPFLLLIFQSNKKKITTIRRIAFVVLAAHAAEIYWFIIPERGPKLADQPTILWGIIPDAIAVVTIGSVVALTFLRRLGKASLYPVGDPRLQESINVLN